MRDGDTAIRSFGVGTGGGPARDGLGLGGGVRQSAPGPRQPPPPNFIDVPIARSITDRATPSARIAPFAVLHAHRDDTTHLSKIDVGGSAVALTYTLVEDFGSKAMVASAGFRLNNKKGDFNLIPGRTDTSGRITTPANLIAPGKRMLNSQAPTVVLH